LTNEQNNAWIVAILGTFAVVSVAGFAYLVKKLREAEEREREVPPPIGSEVPYEPVEE
jgi:hypothetical protein